MTPENPSLLEHLKSVNACFDRLHEAMAKAGIESLEHLTELLPQMQLPGTRTEADALLDRIIEAANNAGIDSAESLIAWLPVMQMPDEEAEPAAHMFACDLERFQTVGEHTATAYSLEVGSPTHGETVPVFRHPPAKLPVQSNEAAVEELADQLRAEIASTVKAPYATAEWVEDVLAEINRYILARLEQDMAFGKRTRAIEESRARRAAIEEALYRAVPEAQPWICYADQKPDESHIDDENAIWMSVEGRTKRTSLRGLAVQADWHGATQVHWKPTRSVRPTPFQPASKTD